MLCNLFADSFVHDSLFTLNGDLAGLVLILRIEVLRRLLNEIIRTCVDLRFGLPLTLGKNLCFIFGFILLGHI